jgi:catechol 2,3-dioxygenase-like lactoylglutathione lyase family enzyme
MITSLAFVAYPVSDIAAARAFYEGVLGLRLTHEFDGEWYEYDIGDSTFAISAADAEHPVPVRGALVGFEVDDIDAEISRLGALGVEPSSAVADTPVCRFLRLRDPDGSEVVIHQRKK